MMKKKAQEELVGFVAVVVLVAVIAVVLLGITLRQEPSEIKKESRDIALFLESAMEYTAPCATAGANYLKLREMLSACYKDKGAVCTSGRKVCDVLKESINGILNASWAVGEERALKGYVFNATFAQNTSRELFPEEVLTLQEGRCTLRYKSAERFFAVCSGRISSECGTLTVSLRLCY